MLQLIEVTSELGAGTRGASLGVGALKVAAFNSESTFFSDYNSVVVPNFNHYLFSPNTTPSAIRIEHIKKEFNEVFNSVKNELSNNNFPFILAGDHSTAAATIAGIQESHPGKRLGVIWVDAHADLHSPYTSPSGNIHGMPLAIACGVDNISQQVNDVSIKAEEYWKGLKSLSKDSISAKDLVFIGVRDTEAPEDYLMKSEEIKNFKVEDVIKVGGKEIASQTLNLLSGCDIIYVSFDVDSMDPEEVSHGTGTPVSGGIPVDELKLILNAFAASEKLVAFETVEVNPTLDEKKNKMAETTLPIIAEVASIIASRL